MSPQPGQNPAAVVPDQLRPVVSACTVHRINQLPVEALDLALPRTLKSLFRETACEQQLANVAGPLTEALHDAVPAFEDFPHLRRAALELRRRVHNRRPAEVPENLLQDLRDRLGDTAGRLLDEWLNGIRGLAALRSETDAYYEKETAQATEQLRSLLSEEGLAQGLAQASPHLLNHLTSKPLEPHSKAARSVLGYISRAALKTSPFSRLTALALTGQAVDGTGSSYVDHHHVRAWLDALARDERFAAALQVEPNQSLRRLGSRPYLLTPSYGGPGQTAWRTDTLVDASRYTHLVEALVAWPRMTIDECVRRIGGKDPYGGFLRLLDTGWLRLVIPWSAIERHPLRALARAVEGLPDPTARRTRTLLDRLDKEAAEICLLPGPERARSVDQLAERIRSIPDGDPRPAVRYAVYEDALSDIPAPATADTVQQDLTDLGSLIRPYIFRSHVYDWLVDEFVDRYGAGGHCPDVFAFLWSVTASPGFDGSLFRALQRDHAEAGRPTDRAWLPVSDSSAPPTTAVLYQVAARSFEGIRRGDHWVVVNQYNSGTGGLVARFRHELDRLVPDGAALTDHLRSWISELFPRAIPHQVTLSGDVNGMHHAAYGVLPPLQWPGEPSHADDAEHPGASATTALRHCPATNTLEFTDAANRVVAPVYLGVVPQHLVPGAARLLLCLSDPWVNGARLCCTRHPMDVSPPPAGEAVELIPRETHHRLVLGRRSWRLAPAALPRPAQGEKPQAFLRRVHHWRTAHQLPDEVFISIEKSASPAGGVSSDGKPFWLSFRSPHALWSAANNVAKAKDAIAIRLAEALPDRSAYWLRDGGGYHRAVEHVSLLRWERPKLVNCPERKAVALETDQEADR